MERKNNKLNSKTQEKRQVLISLSIEARALREEKKHTANTIEEAAFWESRTINYMLLRWTFPNIQGVENRRGSYQKRGESYCHMGTTKERNAQRYRRY